MKDENRLEKNENMEYILYVSSIEARNDLYKTMKRTISSFIRANFKSPADSFELLSGICQEGIFGGYFQVATLKLLLPTAQKSRSNLIRHDF